MSASTIRADPSEAAASDDSPILLLQTQRLDNHKVYDLGSCGELLAGCRVSPLSSTSSFQKSGTSKGADADHARLAA
jgi:hypothetical protein